MSVATDADLQESIRSVERLFARQTGIRSVQTRIEAAGPETFLHIMVGRKAPLYTDAVFNVNQQLSEDDPFRGSVLLDPQNGKEVLSSAEVELLRSLMRRSLRITTENVQQVPVVTFAPFRGGEEQHVAQTAHHAILGRRGVGKSSLILIACRRAVEDGNIPVWVDLQPYHGRDDLTAPLEVLRDVFDEAVESVRVHAEGQPAEALEKARRLIDEHLDMGQEVSLDQIRKLVPRLRSTIKEFTRDTGKQLFVFLDDAHLLGATIQPTVFDLVYSMLKGSGGWLKIAGVKNLLRLYDASEKVGLQSPDDVQQILLDLTLVDPGAARDHLSAVLQGFLDPCGFKRSSELAPSRAIDRLVWCSAGVPRDFLWLLERSIAFAIQHRRKRVGVQEVNLAVGEFAQDKMAEVEQDTSEDANALRETLDRLKDVVLDHHRSNSFLVRQDRKHEGYRALQKLVDLRLVHLIHPSITPSKAGERYEAYLLDYSFYTGMRRRHGLSELKIRANEPVRYDELRGLPRIDLSSLCAGEA